MEQNIIYLTHSKKLKINVKLHGINNFKVERKNITLPKKY